MRHLKSSWASPLHMVKKKDGTWRPCMDYRQLNQATKQDLYPPPHIEDLSTKLEGMKVFSTINLRKGYWQVPVAAAALPNAQDGRHHPLWAVGVPEDTFWADECGPDLSEFHGQHLVLVDSPMLHS